MYDEVLVHVVDSLTDLADEQDAVSLSEGEVVCHHTFKQLTAGDTGEGEFRQALNTEEEEKRREFRQALQRSRKRREEEKIVDYKGKRSRLSTRSGKIDYKQSTKCHQE